MKNQFVQQFFLAKGLIMAGTIILLGLGISTITVAADKSQTIRVGVPDLPPGKGNPYSALGTPSIYI